MNSGSLDKTRTQVVRRVVFLFVLALVALAYLATPLIAFACGKGGGGKNPNGGGNNNAASDKQAINDLKAGVKNGEKLTDLKGNTIKFTDLKQGEQFTVSFQDGVSLKGEFLGQGKAIVTLPSGKQVICQPQPDGSGVVTNVDGTPTANSKPIVPTANGDKRVFAEFQNGSPSQWQLFSPRGLPIALSSIKKAGQTFLVRKVGATTAMRAEFLGKGNVYHDLVVVTLSAHTVMTIALSQL